MINVLHIFSDADIGGIASVVYNYYSFIDRTEFNFDIAVSSEQIGIIGEKLRSLGARIHHLPLKSKYLIKYCESLKNILMYYKYDAIHVHENETSYVALMVAKRCGVKIRIAHMHSAYKSDNLYLSLRRGTGKLLNPVFSTHILACGEKSSELLCGKKAFSKESKCFILPNAVDLQRFKFDAKIRESERKALGLCGRYVMGVIGRLSPEKNIEFCVRLIKDYHAKNPDAVLMIIGDGPDRAALESIAASENMSDYVLFLGKRTDIERLYQAMDALVMPSFYEGYPVVAVEALASGLPVLLSDCVTREFSFSEYVSYLSLNDKKAWLCTIDLLRSRKRNESAIDELKHQTLDIRDAVKMLERIYSGNV